MVNDSKGQFREILLQIEMSKEYFDIILTSYGDKEKISRGEEYLTFVENELTLSRPKTPRTFNNPGLGSNNNSFERPMDSNPKKTQKINEEINKIQLLKRLLRESVKDNK